MNSRASVPSGREEQQLRNRLEELAASSWQKQIPVFTNFLGLQEQNIFHSLEKQLAFASPVLFGGFTYAERQVAGFLPDAFLYETPVPPELLEAIFPIRCICISPPDVRFSDRLSHRDYLGAILSLGIDRAKIGDILVKENKAWVFCRAENSDFIIHELTRVRHTSVHCEEVQIKPDMLPSPATQRIEGSIPSPRIDALTALAFHTSRSSLKDLPESGKVFVNGKMVTDGSFHVRAGDIVSVRGRVRFRYLGEMNQSKKGRYFAALEKFV